MISVWAVAAVLACGSSDPAGPVYNVPGPAFHIPVNAQVTREAPAVRVELWVSSDLGRTWERSGEVSPSAGQFRFVAPRPGEYWFATRLRFPDGSLSPTLVEALAPQLRVRTATGMSDLNQPGTNAPGWLADAVRPNSAPRPGGSLDATASELEDELARLELDLIRKELKRLASAEGFGPDVADKIDQLRMRLRDAQDRLRQRTGRGTSSTGATLDPLPTAPVPPPRPEPPPIPLAVDDIPPPDSIPPGLIGPRSRR